MVRGFDQIGDGDANELDMLDALRVTVASIDVVAAIRLDNLRENLIWVLSSTSGSIIDHFLLLFFTWQMLLILGRYNKWMCIFGTAYFTIWYIFYYIRQKIAERCESFFN